MPSQRASSSGPDPRSSGSRLEQLVRDYLEDRQAAGLSPRTIEGDLRQRLERVFLPWCREAGVTDPAQLDQRQMNRFVTDLRARTGPRGPLSPHTIASYVKTTNAFLAWLRREGEPASGRAHRPRLPEREVEILTDAEVRTMVELARPRDALIVQLLAQSGIRVSELIGLRVQDLVEQEVMLLDGRRERQVGIRVIGKGDRERFVPIPPDLHRRLRAFARSRPVEAQSDRLWLSSRRDRRTGRYEPLTISGVQQMIRFLGRSALGRPVHPHLFRHTYISKLVRKGIDATVIRRYVGHSSAVLIDRIYGHLRPQDTASLVLAALRE
ncbi:MAG TPA: tyrosine-type recombinase/integrase [Candidatus Dormibacteraeota bacterium]|jgi:integrase|nr:tyrosine-type recombinase/integrase [Candidatus Dormibacteraeota bacterium]